MSTRLVTMAFLVGHAPRSSELPTSIVARNACAVITTPFGLHSIHWEGPRDEAKCSMAATTWMFMIKFARSSSARALANPGFKLTSVSQCWMRLECSHISQQWVSDVRSIRPLSFCTACWKPSGPKTGDVAADSQSRKVGQKEQGKGRRFFRSRTPWLGKRSSRHTQGGDTHNLECACDQVFTLHSKAISFVIICTKITSF